MSQCAKMLSVKEGQLYMALRPVLQVHVSHATVTLA